MGTGVPTHWSGGGETEASSDSGGGARQGSWAKGSEAELDTIPSLLPPYPLASEEPPQPFLLPGPHVSAAG